MRNLLTASITPPHRTCDSDKKLLIIYHKKYSVDYTLCPEKRVYVFIDISLAHLIVFS